MANTFRFFFLFSSFGPLYGIFAVKLYYTPMINGLWKWGFVGATFLALILFIVLVSMFKTYNGTLIEISDIKPKDNEVFGYITTYIPPLLARDMSDPAVVIPIGILYLIIFAAYMRLDSPYLNPFFIFTGYRIYEAKGGLNKSVVTIISRNQILSGKTRLTLFEVGNGTLYYCERGS